MGTEIREPKKLRLLVLTDYSPYGDAAVSHAAAISLVFRAELIIIPLIDKEKTLGTEFTKAVEMLHKHNLPVVQYSQKLNLKKELYSFIEEHEVMMLVLAVSPKKQSYFSYRKALKLLKKMRVPVLVTGKALPAQNAYQKIVLPLDYTIYAKEKSLWASYFGRFYKSEIHILAKKYKDEYLRYKLHENVAYTEQLYDKLSIKYQLHRVTTTTENMDYYALDFAKQINATLIMSMTTKYLELGDILTGTKEKKTIRNIDQIPYLYINQRDDLYVLCT